MSESDDPDRDDPHFAHLNRLAQAKKKADMAQQMRRALLNAGALPPRQYVKDMLQFLAEEKQSADAFFQALQADPIQAGGSTTEGEPMPLVDNGESLNISGTIEAVSVNMFTKQEPLPPDKNGSPITKNTNGYKLTITLETFDVETVKKLMLIRTRQLPHKGKVTADLIVWPLQ